MDAFLQAQVHNCSEGCSRTRRARPFSPQGLPEKADAKPDDAMLLDLLADWAPEGAIRVSRDSATRPSGGPARRSSKILQLEQWADLDLEGARRRAGAAFGPVDRLVQILDLPEPVAGREPAIGAIVGERAFDHRALLAG